MVLKKKLELLLEGKSRPEIARRAKLNPNIFADYISKGHMPRADKALRIARVLGVPFEWLIDDSLDWEDKDVAARTISNAGLARELSSRYAAMGARLREVLEKADAINWPVAAEIIKTLPPGEKMPPQIRLAADVCAAINDAKLSILQLDNVPHVRSMVLNELVDALGSMQLAKYNVFFEAETIRDGLPGFLAFQKGIYLRNVLGNAAMFPAQSIQQVKDEFVDEMRRLEQSMAGKQAKK